MMSARPRIGAFWPRPKKMTLFLGDLQLNSSAGLVSGLRVKASQVLRAKVFPWAPNKSWAAGRSSLSSSVGGHLSITFSTRIHLPSSFFPHQDLLSPFPPSLKIPDIVLQERVRIHFQPLLFIFDDFTTNLLLLLPYYLQHTPKHNHHHDFPRPRTLLHTC